MLFLQRTLICFPALTLVAQQLPLTPDPGDLVPSSGLREHCTHVGLVEVGVGGVAWGTAGAAPQGLLWG